MAVFPDCGSLDRGSSLFANLNKICGAYNRAAAKQGAGYQEHAGQDTAQAPEEDTMALTEMQEGSSTLMPPVIDTGMESTIFCKRANMPEQRSQSKTVRKSFWAGTEARAIWCC